MLNTQQIQAVEITTGPVAIIAGPGTGKTKTLVAKIEHLIKQNLAQPSQILALTFTNKAAAEIKERLVSLPLFNQHNSMMIGTFHSFCHYLLTHFFHQQIQLISETDRKKIVVQLIKNESGNGHLTNISLPEILLQISQLKFDHALNKNNKTNDQKLNNFLKLYQQEITKLQKYDFDDLLIETAERLHREERVTKQIAATFSHILIDEFQDTHPIQYEIIKLITNHQTSPNITVIGDPLQTIYSFRGADGNIFQQFSQDFPMAPIITLNINYRSRPQIIKLSHSLFPQSLLLSAYNQEEAKIKFLTTLNEQSESQWIINHISQLMGGTNLNQASDYAAANNSANFNDFAIIFRTHHLALNLEKNLDNSSLPYQVIGELSFFETKEIAFLTAAFNDLVNHNPASQLLINDINLPVSNLTEKLDAARQELILLDSHQLIDKLLKISRLDQIIRKSKNKQKYLQSFYQYLNQFTGPDWLKQCVVYFNRLQTHDYYDAQADRISLLTMHAAKGLEFKHVFVIGFENDLIPHAKSQSEGNLIEEKKLFYVTLTRAKETLTVINCQERFQQVNRQISQFFAELDQQTFTIETDPQIKKILKFRQKYAEQKRQMSLF